MANIQSIGGYRLDLNGLSEGKVLFFRGDKWVLASVTDPAPATVPMITPVNTSELPFSIDGVPVMIHDLQPGDVLTLCLFSSAVQVDTIGKDPTMFSMIENVPWSQLYCDMGDYHRPLARLELMPEPTKGLTTNAPTRTYQTEIT